MRCWPKKRSKWPTHWWRCTLPRKIGSFSRASPATCAMTSDGMPGWAAMGLVEVGWLFGLGKIDENCGKDGAQEDFWMLSFKAHPFYWLICVFCGYLTLKNQVYPAVCINNERVDLAKWHWRSWWAFYAVSILPWDDPKQEQPQRWDHHFALRFYIMYEGDVDIDKDGEVAPELTQGAVEPDIAGSMGPQANRWSSESTKNTNSQTLHSTQIISVGCLFRTFFFPGKRGEKLPGFSHQGGHPVCQEQKWHGALLWRDPQLQGLSAGRWNLGKPWLNFID